MRKKFIGPPNPGPDGEDQGHEVLVAGRKLGTVKSGEELEIPDEEWKELVAEHKAADCPLPVWPQELWEDVKASGSKGKGDS